jgi:hypothetical protein
LYLGGTNVTDAGLVHLERLGGLQKLVLYGTKVSDAGLPRLERLTGLRELLLYGTQVTEAAIAKLRTALPGVKVRGPQWAEG